MPTVPIFESTRGTSVIGQNISVPGATPAAFGAGVGQALQGAGAALQQQAQRAAQTALTIQADTNRVETTNALLDANRALTDFQYDPEDGLFSQFGINAKDSGTRLETEIERIKKSVTLANPRQQEAFDANFSRTSEAARVRALSHESGQMRVATVASLTTIFDKTKEAVFFDPDSNATIVQSLEDMEAASAAISGLTGESPEVAAARRDAGESSIHGSVIDRYLQDGRTRDAKDYFDQNKEDLDPALRRKLDGAIDTATDRDETIITATGYADIHGKNTAAGLADIARDIEDPVERRKVSTEFSSQSGLLADANFAQEGAAYESAARSLVTDFSQGNRRKVLADIQDGKIQTSAANLKALRNQALGPPPTVEGQKRIDAAHKSALAVTILNAIDAGGNIRVQTGQVDLNGVLILGEDGRPLTKVIPFDENFLRKHMDNENVSAGVREFAQGLLKNDGYATSFSDIQRVYNVALGLPPGTVIGQEHPDLVSGVVEKLRRIDDPTDEQILSAIKPFLQEFTIDVPFGFDPVKTQLDIIREQIDVSTARRVNLTPIEDAGLSEEIDKHNDEQARLARKDSLHIPRFIENTERNREVVATNRAFSRLGGGLNDAPLSLDDERVDSFLSDTAEEHEQSQIFFNSAKRVRPAPGSLIANPSGLIPGLPAFRPPNQPAGRLTGPPIGPQLLELFGQSEDVNQSELNGTEVDELFDRIDLE